MNKKFSTLVAGLLFASAFSAYAGTAAPNFTTPNGVDTRALTTNFVRVTNDSCLNVVADTVVGVLDGFTNNARLQAFQGLGFGVAGNGHPSDTLGCFLSSFTVDGREREYATSIASELALKSFYFRLNGDKITGENGLDLSIDGEQNFDIIPLAKSNGDKTKFFALRTKRTPAKYVKFTKGLSAPGGFTLFEPTTDAGIDSAAIFASVETAYTDSIKGTDLNARLKNGFNMSVAYKGDELGGTVFGGKLTAMKHDGTNFVQATDGTLFYIKKDDGTYIVFDGTMNGANAVKGGFAKVDSLTLKRWISNNDTARAQFKIKKADNGANTTEVTVDGKRRLYVNVSINTNVLTAVDPAKLVGTNIAENWATTSFSATSTLDFRTLLTGKYVKVSFVKKNTTSTDASVAYKTNGILGLKYDVSKGFGADYIKSSSVVAEDPAVMWAPSIATGGNGDTLVLTNRENTNVKVKIGSLRIEGDVLNLETLYQSNSNSLRSDALIEGEQLKIEFVNSVTKTDGYMVEAENVLRNTSYYLGQSRRNADGDVPAYWAENHGTHQIGATVNKEEATQWRLELLKKTDAKYNSHIDSVLVVSDLYVYNATRGITSFKDTLAVLPYAFQNKGNREYVKLNDKINLEYFMCDDKNKDYPRNAYTFALKKKPGNTFNYFNLDTTLNYTNGSSVPMSSVNGDDKVYLKNSLDKGTWENVEAYSDDANSLMVIEKVDAPEYRKVKKEWGDIVKIFREEYPTEVLFEKRDPKSVVDKQTLSFLNVNNSISGANPALFVDTAYVNRKDVNGIENTRYQYLLAVDVDRKSSVYCPHNPLHNTPEWIKENGGHCDDAIEGSSVVKGRFLINLIDTAFSYKQSNLHKNPYINAVEADEDLAKLSFVDGTHIKDTLLLTRKGGEVEKLYMDSPDFNLAKFAFRYVDNKSGSFKIQTQFKSYEPDTKEDFEATATNEGYLRWVNGTIVVTNRYANGETFNMEENYKGNPVTNEPTAVTEVSVIAGTGSVTIKNATGKSVVISNILGQVIAKTTITSDNATISVPAGIVVVSVDGEAVKAIVK